MRKGRFIFLTGSFICAAIILMNALETGGYRDNVQISMSQSVKVEVIRPGQVDPQPATLPVWALIPVFIVIASAVGWYILINLKAHRRVEGE